MNTIDVARCAAGGNHAAVRVAGDVDVGRAGGGRGRRGHGGQMVRVTAGGPVDQAQRDGQELHAVRPGVRLLLDGTGHGARRRRRHVDGNGGQTPGPGGGRRTAARLQLHTVRAPRFELHPVRPGRGVHARRQQDTQTPFGRGRGRAGGSVRPVRRQRPGQP